MPSTGDLALAFGITAAAGLATSIGSAVVFLPKHWYQPQTLLSVSLGFAAGVMVYVSTIEIFFKGLDEFEIHYDDIENVDRNLISVENYEPSPKAYYAATGSFFFGILLTWVLDYFIHSLYGRFGKNQPSLQLPEEELAFDDFEEAFDDDNESPESGHLKVSHNNTVASHTSLVSPATLAVPPGSASPSVPSSVPPSPSARGRRSTVDQQSNAGRETDLDAVATHAELGRARRRSKRLDEKKHRKAKDLIIMAIITAVAVSLHNFPEGMATFIATAKDPSIGSAIAIAIAVHNIPEGICVAVPVYFATHSRWRGFLMGTLSGAAETLAGAIGWAILSNKEDSDISPLAYALLFGMVSGMMIFISFRELLPTARGYDPQDTYVTKALVAGMMVMAASLMLFVA